MTEPVGVAPTPTTQAGRALLFDLHEYVAPFHGWLPERIAAIEAEAAAAARAEMPSFRAAVDGMAQLADAEAERDALAAENAALREIAKRGVLARTYTVAGVTAYRDTSAKGDAEYLANPADWLAKHDEKVRAEADGWDAMLAQTAAIRPIIDAEIERRDRIAAGDEAAGTMPPAEWDALASLPAVPNLPGRYLDLASPDAEKWLAERDERRDREAFLRALAYVRRGPRPAEQADDDDVAVADALAERDAASFKRGWHAGHGTLLTEQVSALTAAHWDADYLAAHPNLVDLDSPEAERRLVSALGWATRNMNSLTDLTLEQIVGVMIERLYRAQPADN